MPDTKKHSNVASSSLVAMFDAQASAQLCDAQQEPGEIASNDTEATCEVTKLLPDTHISAADGDGQPAAGRTGDEGHGSASGTSTAAADMTTAEAASALLIT